jgi:GNAT superfamily N-acetyltransferase
MDSITKNGKANRDWLSTGLGTTPYKNVMHTPQGKENDGGSPHGNLANHHNEAAWTPARHVAAKDANDEGIEHFKDAPLPAPLHIIQSAVPQSAMVKTKTRLSNQTWASSEVSSAEAQLDDDGHGAVAETAASGEESLTNIDERVFEQLEAYLGPWLMRAADCTKMNPVAEWAKQSAHSQYDIDTDTGCLLPPVEYPETKPRAKAVDEDGRDITFKQLNMTANLNIKFALKHLEEKKGEPIYPSQALVKHETAVIQTIGPEWPVADCALRPATLDDLDGIVEVANLQLKDRDCPHIFDSRAITVQDIKRIFDASKFNLRPFIVATTAADELLDPTKWPLGSEKAFQEYVRYRESQPKASEKILGFAFVSEPRVGFLNLPCPGSRHSGQIRLAVHPEHRRKKYGAALLDRILLSVNPYHRSLVDYGWECPEDTLIYEKPATYNHRQYARVYIEVMAPKDRETDWRGDMLERFEFTRVACYEDAIKTDEGDDSQWLNLIVWERRCQSASNIPNREPGTWLRKR